MKKYLIAVSIAALFMGSAEARKHPKPIPTAIAFSAKSYLVADLEGQVLTSQDSDIVRPIASISKLMVALLVTEQDLSEQLAIPTHRTVQSSIPGNLTSLSRKELLTLALVRSDNFAAQILCANLSNCVISMNDKAIELGMYNTHYNEPTGLDIGNVSTAQDLLKLLLAVSMNPMIIELSSLPKAEIYVGKRTIKVQNTNPLTSKYSVVVSKTGFTNPAGGCMVLIVKNKVFILLGSKNTRTRVPDMEKLIKENDKDTSTSPTFPSG